MPALFGYLPLSPAGWHSPLEAAGTRGQSPSQPWWCGSQRTPGGPRIERRTIVRCLAAWAASTALPCSAAPWPDGYLAEPFQFHANFALAEQLPLLKAVAGLATEVPQQLELAAPREPIHVFLFDRKSTYQQYVRSHFPQVPQRSALFIKDQGPGMVFAHCGKEFDVDLRHEATHAVLHAALPFVPLWLDEGVAEYFEIARGERVGGNPYLSTLRRQARWGQVTDFKGLEAITEMPRMQAKHYREAWAVIHFLLHGPPLVQGVLSGYLRDIESGLPPDSLELRLRRIAPDYPRLMVQHFRSFSGR